MYLFYLVYYFYRFNSFNVTYENYKKTKNVKKHDFGIEILHEVGGLKQLLLKLC